MSSAEHLRELVEERLTAAAEEKFSGFKTTIVQYEQEIDRQRKLLDIVWKPEVKLRRIEIPQQHVCKKEEVHAEQQLSNKDCNSSVIQKEPEPPQIKEEQNGPLTSQEVKEVALNQETHSLLLTPTHEESDDCDTEPESNHQPLSHNSCVVQIQDQIRGNHKDSGLKSDAESKSRLSEIDNNKIKNPERVRMSRKTCRGERPFKCETCGKAFKKKTALWRHLRVHTGERPYSCDTCGKRFSDAQYLKHHMMIHTGERPYTCETCGKHYRFGSAFRLHLKKHTDDRPHTCGTCKRAFYTKSQLELHMRTHTGEKPYPCNICGKDFISRNELSSHMRTHTGERPYLCRVCGIRYISRQILKRHFRIHTGEKPFTCTTCGKTFRIQYNLQRHMKTHTGEKPYSCQNCGKRFIEKSKLKKHMGMHTRENSHQPKKKSGKRFD